MLKTRYKNIIAAILVRHIPEDARVFVFGSSLKSNDFSDIDIGVDGGRLNESDLMKAREELEEAYIPYKVDLVNFNKVDKKFKNAIFKDKVLWLI